MSADLIALAQECGAEVLETVNDRYVTFNSSDLEAFAAATLANPAPLDERELFEAYRARVDGKKPLTWDAASSDQACESLKGRYFLRADHQAWETWQAARADLEGRRP